MSADFQSKKTPITDVAPDITADMVNADCVHIRCWMLCGLCSSCLVRTVDRFYRAMLCIRGTSHGPVSVSVSVSVSVCHKSEFYYNG